MSLVPLPARHIKRFTRHARCTVRHSGTFGAMLRSRPRVAMITQLNSGAKNSKYCSSSLSASVQFGEETNNVKFKEPGKEVGDSTSRGTLVQ